MELEGAGGVVENEDERRYLGDDNVAKDDNSVGDDDEGDDMKTLLIPYRENAENKVFIPNLLPVD